MTPTFSAADPETWAMTLTLDQIAEIWQRKPRGIAQSCWAGRFIPAPFSKQPYRWRKADVVRFLQGGRTSLRGAA